MGGFYTGKWFNDPINQWEASKPGDIVYYNSLTSKLEVMKPSEWDTGVMTNTAIGIVVHHYNNMVSIIGINYSDGTSWGPSGIAVDDINVNVDVSVNDLDGLKNSNYMRSLGTLFDSLTYCNTLTTPGTNAGDWYLPSVGQLCMYACYKYLISESRVIVGHSSLPVISQSWSSNTYIGGNNNVALRVTINNSRFEVTMLARTSSLLVYPFLNMDYNGNIITE